MAKKYLLAGVLILSVLLSACTKIYPAADIAVTPSPTGPFGNQSGATAMAALQTEAAGQERLSPEDLTAAAAVTGTVTLNGTSITPVTQITFTPTPIIGGVTVTATTPVVAGVTPQPAATTAIPPTTIVSRPATYVLQKYEHPYCIARRFNVNPDDLLALSGITREEAYSLPTGTVLTIPQTGFFPGDRALLPHPTTYTVTGNDDTTIYGVACVFGDVDPAAIAQRNNLSISATLTIGQTLNIP